MEEVLKQLGEAGEALQLRETDGEAAVEAEANATPIIRFVDLILYQAIQDRASDIHFEPFENEFKSATASMGRFTRCRRHRAILRFR